jgi:hypothetical protein
VIADYNYNNSTGLYVWYLDLCVVGVYLCTLCTTEVHMTYCCATYSCMYSMCTYIHVCAHINKYIIYIICVPNHASTLTTVLILSNTYTCSLLNYKERNFSLVLYSR